MRRYTTAFIAAAAIPLAAGNLQAQEFPQTLDSQAGPLEVTKIADIDSPWGATFLPDGAMLVTRRTGELVRVSPDGKVSAPVSGTPEVFSRGQGGLLDVALSPDFANDRLVYLSFAESRDGGANTSVGRGKLSDDATAIEDFEVVFRAQPAVPGPNHFGSRLAFAPDGNLFVTLGERFNYMEEAQNPDNHLGKVVRIAPDGSVPPGNPFASGGGAPEVWSYGHRNVQGAAIHPETGELWTAEFGPRGGDEVNRPQAGRNHGWPVVSHGEHYSGRNIPDPAGNPEFADAVRFWVPAISPSGITFMSGDGFPGWKGDLVLGGLSGQTIVRLDIENGEAVGEERLDIGLRIRDVVEGPDGALYALSDGPDGAVLRIAPRR